MLSENPSWDEILCQDEEWLPANRVPLPISQMGRRHATNTVSFLVRRAKRIHEHVWVRWLWIASSHDGGDMAQDSLDSVVTELEWWMGREGEWLCRQPLLQALLTQAIEGPDDEPREQAHHIEEVSF